MASKGSFMRQLSEGKAGKSTSKRWAGMSRKSCGEDCGGDCEGSWGQMEGLRSMYGIENGGMVMKKRVMVVVDETQCSKQAMMWALTHLTNKGDLLTLLHVLPCSIKGSDSPSSPYLATSLGSLCKASKPQDDGGSHIVWKLKVEVEALVIEGPKLATVLSQVKKLEVAVLVLGQRKPSPLSSCLCGPSSTEDFVEECIAMAECWTIGVRKQREGMGGYLINTRWQKNFWLLA